MENYKFCNICKRYWLDVFEKSHDNYHKFIRCLNNRAFNDKEILENLERVPETL